MSFLLLFNFRNATGCFWCFILFLYYRQKRAGCKGRLAFLFFMVIFMVFKQDFVHCSGSSFLGRDGAVVGNGVGMSGRIGHIGVLDTY